MPWDVRKTSITTSLRDTILDEFNLWGEQNSYWPLLFLEHVLYSTAGKVLWWYSLSSSQHYFYLPLYLLYCPFHKRKYLRREVHNNTRYLLFILRDSTVSSERYWSFVKWWKLLNFNIYEIYQIAEFIRTVKRESRQGR